MDAETFAFRNLDSRTLRSRFWNSFVLKFMIEYSLRRYEEEAARKEWNRPQVIAHSAVTKRFERYKLTNGYNSIINTRQFGGNSHLFELPVDFRIPDVLYEENLTLKVFLEEESVTFTIDWRRNFSSFSCSW